MQIGEGGRGSKIKTFTFCGHFIWKLPNMNWAFCANFTMKNSEFLMSKFCGYHIWKPPKDLFILVLPHANQIVILFSSWQ